MFIKFLLFIPIFFTTTSRGIQVEVQELVFNEIYRNSTNDTLEYIFYFNMTELNLMSEDSLISQNKPLGQDAITSLKITATVEEDVSSPVMFSIRYNYITTSWNLPYSTRFFIKMQRFSYFFTLILALDQTHMKSGCALCNTKMRHEKFK